MYCRANLQFCIDDSSYERMNVIKVKNTSYSEVIRQQNELIFCLNRHLRSTKN
jgi:hypothetical protein